MEKLLLNNVLVAVLFTVVYGEYIVTHFPQYVHFRETTSNLNVNEVGDLVTSSLGLSNSKAVQWDGLLSGNVFHRPKAVALVTIYDASANLPSTSAIKYSTLDDSVSTASVVDKIEEVFPTGKSILVDFSLDDTVFDIEARNPGIFVSLSAALNEVADKLVKDISVLGDLSLYIKTLSASQEPDVLFLGEVLVVKEILNQMKQHQNLAKDKYPDFFHFRFLSLTRISAKYGKESSQYNEAQVILGALLTEVTKGLRELYNDNIIVSAISLQNPMPVISRKGRSLLETPNTSESSSGSSMDNIGLTGTVDEDYAVIFNIILWGMIGLALAIYAISYGIWNMDPGRDSIIYRMTSQRMKRD